MPDDSPSPDGDDNSFSLVNLGKLSKPINTLFEKISLHLGAFLKPTHIRREAKAKAEASIIKANAEIEVQTLKDRAAARKEAEEIRNQRNLEQILVSAVPQVNDNAKPETINDDWLANFFDKGKLISEPEMQDLWSKVLAGEANSPGKFSKRTVNFLAEMEKEDADSFSKLLNFCIDLGHPNLLIFDHKAPIYEKNGIDFRSLKHLESLGLIQVSDFADFVLEVKHPRFMIRYFDQDISVDLSRQDKKQLPLGKARLTKLGLQLAGLCSTKPIPGFVKYIISGPWRAIQPPTQP